MPVRLLTRYFRAPHETKSILLQPQLHSTIDRYTSFYTRKPGDEFNAIFFWTTGLQLNLNWQSKSCILPEVEKHLQYIAMSQTKLYAPLL
jgi:hypothetical protein